MTLIKTVGCILIIVSGCFFSRRIIGNDDASIQRLTSLMELLKAIKSRIENYCMPTDEILSELPAELFERCGYDPAFLPHTVDELISYYGEEKVKNTLLWEKLMSDILEDSVVVE